MHVSQNTVCHSVFQTEKHKIYQGTQLIYSNELTRGWELLAARYPICHLQLTARQKTGQFSIIVLFLGISTQKTAVKNEKPLPDREVGWVDNRAKNM